MTATDESIASTSDPIPSTVDELMAWAERRRARGPVYRDEQQASWQVFRYADVGEVLGDPGRYLADLGDLLPTNPDLELVQRGNFVNMDGPRHKMLRGLVAQAFTHRVVSGMEPRIKQLTAEILDDIGTADRVDLVERLAYPLPVMVIADLIGIPPADRSLFRSWAEEFFPFDEKEPQLTSSQEAIDTLTPTVREMTAYLLDLIRDRRFRPTDDLTSRLVKADLDGDRLTADDMVGLIALLLTAGHITTAALLSSTVFVLDQHPEAAAQVRADRSLLPTAIEEVLRFRPPLPRLTRRTAVDVTLGGQRIPAGEIVVLWLASANRDEAQFPAADRFDVARRPNRHLSFGHGIHFCLGAPLARLETRIALDAMLDRYRDIAVEDGAAFHHPFAILSAKRLPVRVSLV